jgi:hypothetical protein
MEQNSKTPSNAGLSSPTRTINDQELINFRGEERLTPLPMERQLLRSLRGDLCQEIDIFVRMERRHLLRCRSPRYLSPTAPVSSEITSKRKQKTHQTLHLVQHPIGRDEVVGHTHSERFHRMPRSIGVVPHIRYSDISIPIQRKRERDIRS